MVDRDPALLISSSPIEAPRTDWVGDGVMGSYGSFPTVSPNLSLGIFRAAVGNNPYDPITSALGLGLTGFYRRFSEIQPQPTSSQPVPC
jgi:hypothetical protein